MSTKFACSGRNWPLFFIWLIFLDLRLSIHLPTLVHLHRDKFIRCFLLRFRAVKLGGWDLFVSVLGGPLGRCLGLLGR